MQNAREGLIPVVLGSIVTTTGVLLYGNWIIWALD